MRHPRLTMAQKAFLDEVVRQTGATMVYLMPEDAFMSLRKSFGDLPTWQVEELVNDYLRELENQGGPKPKRPRGRPRKNPVS
jgi:hypothetical protein